MIYSAIELLTGLKRITLRQFVLVAIVVAVPGGLVVSAVVEKVWSV